MEIFELHYGKILKNIDVEYVTSGIPKYDDEGHIINAIIYCSNFKGSKSILKESHIYLKENGKFNRDDFFFITITPFGLPDSYSPSSSDLRCDFPEYNFKDIVNFKMQFLIEKFNLHHVLGIIGEEVGGYEVFTWASEYPEYMDFILILNSDFKLSGYRYIMTKGVEAIIESNDDYLTNKYSVSISKIIIAINTFLFAQAFSEKVFSQLSPSEIEALLDDYIDDGLNRDIYDLNLRNNAILNYDVENQLNNIKAKTLVICSDHSVYFHVPVNIEVLKENIDDLTILSFESKKENYYDEEDYSVIGDELISFLKECLKIN